MNVCLVAAPLTARSGVYRSALELVEEARRRGLEWSAFLGVSDRAAGVSPDHPAWIVERTLEPEGLGGVRRLRSVLRGEPLVEQSSLVISLVPQTDMALATTATRWVAYLRGLPWPADGESRLFKRWAWQACEVAALRRADAVWATTLTLQEQIGDRVPIELVPAGIKPVARLTDGSERGTRLVWAARFDHDKNPGLFVDVVRGLEVDGVMYGAGPLRDQCQAEAPPNLTLPGWAAPEDLWTGCLAYVGTSTREAFGRSAIEAGMSGMPLILSTAFGAAPLLYTDADLASRFVLEPGAPDRWRAAARDLDRDAGLRRAVSEHVHDNARVLTIEASVRLVETRAHELARNPIGERHGVTSVPGGAVRG